MKYSTQEPDLIGSTSLIIYCIDGIELAKWIGCQPWMFVMHGLA
jgi:hypothetical protein